MQAIIFDLFETLVSVIDSDHPGITDAATVLGVDITLAKQKYRILRHDRFTGRIRGYREAVNLIAQQTGCPVDQEKIDRLADERRVAFRMHLEQIDEDIIAMLKELRRGNLRIGIVSNTDGAEVAEWDGRPLDVRVDAAVFSHEVGYVKPDARIYAEVCRRLDVRPEECIYIGDGGSDELQGAVDFGMKAYCAAWFLLRHTDALGTDFMKQRAKDFPVLRDPHEVITEILNAGYSDNLNA